MRVSTTANSPTCEFLLSLSSPSDVLALTFKESIRPPRAKGGRQEGAGQAASSSCCSIFPIDTVKHQK
jgi:hypothetical protein